MKTVVCPGSYDPVTFGHLDVIERAAALFDEVIVGVGQNAQKAYLFDPAERLELVGLACEQFANVKVEPLTGLLVDFCRDRSAQAVVKGVRGVTDFDFELSMSQMNHSLTGLETVLLPSSASVGFISSTLVRQVASLGGDVTAYVPVVVAERLARRRGQ